MSLMGGTEGNLGSLISYFLTSCSVYVVFAEDEYGV